MRASGSCGSNQCTQQGRSGAAQVSRRVRAALAGGDNSARAERIRSFGCWHDKPGAYCGQHEQLMLLAHPLRRHRAWRWLERRGGAGLHFDLPCCQDIALQNHTRHPGGYVRFLWAAMWQRCMAALAVPPGAACTAGGQAI